MDSTLPLDPVPGIIQKQNQMQWTQAVSTLAELAMQEDSCCLQMGDYLCEIQRQWGRSKMKLATQEAGLTWSLARQRSWVSTKIPTNHVVRTMNLSYSHLRVLADTDDPQKWGQLTAQNNWTVARLKEEIDMAGDKKAQETGELCIECEQAMTEDMEIISFRIGREKTARCCSAACAATYFTELANSSGDEGSTLPETTGPVAEEEQFNL